MKINNIRKYMSVHKNIYTYKFLCMYEKKCFIKLLCSGCSTGNGGFGNRHNAVKQLQAMVTFCLISELKSSTFK